VKIPPNMTEQQVLAVIDKVANLLAHGFTFGYFTVEDIKQEARIAAMSAMDRYDPTRPLDNFLYRHVKNRLINFKRDNFKRNDPPCISCHRSMAGSTEHDDKQYCSKYSSWLKRNVTKQNIMNPLDISNISDEHESRTRSESGVLEDIAQAELLRIIDAALPLELRSAYLQMRDGYSVPKAKRLEVEHAVRLILQNKGGYE
jgi:DNA-directed RNA polymerase specialized sigma24 family protein